MSLGADFMGRVTIVYDQPVSVHFPAHYRDVYCRKLPSLGWGVSLVCPVLSDGRAMPDLGENCTVHYLRRGLRGGFLSALLKQFLLGFRFIGMIFKRVSVSAADVYLVHDDPFLASISLLRARFYGNKFIYRVSHLKPETVALESGIGPLILSSVARTMRNFLLRHSDHVIAMSDSMADYLVATASLERDKISVVPSMIRVGESKLTSNQQGVVDELLAKMNEFGKGNWLVYAGNVNPARELDFMFDVLSSLRRQGIDAKLLILGVAQKKMSLDHLRRIAESRSLTPWVLFHAPVEEAVLPAALALADLGISPFPLNSVFVHNSPLKTLDYLNAGLPVVATRVPDQQYVIDSSGGGLAVDYTEEAFALAARELLERPRPDRDELVKWLSENRSIEEAAAMIDAVLCSVLTRGKGG